MPQMAPLNWTFLFLTFMMTLIMFSIMNYYMLNYTPLQKSIYKKTSTINWKW